MKINFKKVIIILSLLFLWLIILFYLVWKYNQNDNFKELWLSNSSIETLNKIKDDIEKIESDD